MEKFEVVWDAPEFEYRHKDVSWYWKSVIVAIIILAVAVWQKNFLFAFFVIVAEMLIIVWANRQPHVHRFRLTEKGLHIGTHKFHSISEFMAFGIDPRDHLEWSDIILHHKHRIDPRLKIKISKHQLPLVQSRLRTLLPHQEFQETWFDVLEDYFGF